jgi:hypothetical protein
MCGGLVAGMFRSAIKLFIERYNKNNEKLDDGERVSHVALLLISRGVRGNLSTLNKNIQREDKLTTVMSANIKGLQVNRSLCKIN